MSAPVPGWYSDPNSSQHERWWDGQRWTGHQRALERSATATPAATTTGDAAAEIKSRIPATLWLLPVSMALVFARMIFAHVYAPLAVIVPLFVVLFALLFMYGSRPRLIRRPNVIIYADWLGRQHATQLADVTSAALVHVPEAGKYPIWRLVLGRRNAAPIDAKLSQLYWDIDEVARFLAATGVRLDYLGSASRGQIRQAIPGAFMSWSDRHPVWKTGLMVIAGLLFVPVFWGIFYLLTA